MIEGEEQELILNTLAEQPQEEIRTLEEDIYVIGVESLNGQAGDLTLKNINGEDLVGEGNIALQTPLTETQMDAVDSGIDSTKVAQIATNAGDITTLQNTKQDNLTQTQLNAVNSGIDETKVAQIATNTGNISSNTNRISTIEGKIPSAASSSNQLTDKNYVDNSIATNTANYISDNGRPFQSLADLEAYSGPLTNNDYAFVETVDSAGNDIYTRYKYNASTEQWAEEYTITNPYFTSGQWAAINSGIAANDVTQIGTNKTDIATLTTSKQDALSQTQLDAVNSGINATKVQQIADNTTAIATKQDKLTAGANIQINGTTISATDTTYSAGTGLTLSGTTFNVNDPAPSGFWTGEATTEAEGTSITLSNALATTPKDLTLEGGTTQDTLTGKNLMPMSEAVLQDSVDRTRTFRIDLPIGTYTISFDLSAIEVGTNTSFGVFMQLRYADNTQYDPAIITIDGSTTPGHKTFTFTTTKVVTSDASLTASNIRIALTNWNNGARATLSNIQIESGSATSYEPYCGGIPAPNPTFPEPVNVVTGNQTVNIYGKNRLTLDGITPTGNQYITYEQLGSNSLKLTALSGVGSYSDKTFKYSLEQLGLKVGDTVSLKMDMAGTYASRQCRVYYNAIPSTVVATLTPTDNAKTFTIPSGTTDILILFYVANGETPSANSTATYSNIQLELGSATAYEPYQGGSYPINLGKNLFDKSVAPVFVYRATYSEIATGVRATATSTENYSYLRYIYPVSNYVGDTLTLSAYATASASNKPQIVIGTCDADGNNRTQKASQAGSGALSISYTIEPDAKYIFLAIYSNANGTAVADDYVDYTNVQFEFGSVATSYRAYFTPIELCGIGKKPDGTYTYQDYIWKDGADWKVHKATGKVIFDGTSEGTWSMFSNGNAAYINYPNLPQETDASSPVTAMVMSNYYRGVLSSAINTTTPTEDYGLSYYGSSSTRSRFLLRNKDCANADALKTWLANHNTTVYHLLATPTDTVITNADLIADLEALASAKFASGQNTITSTGVRPNLDAILTIEAFNNNWNGLSQAMLGA